MRQEKKAKTERPGRLARLARLVIRAIQGMAAILDRPVWRATPVRQERRETPAPLDQQAISELQAQLEQLETSDKLARAVPPAVSERLGTLGRPVTPEQSAGQVRQVLKDYRVIQAGLERQARSATPETKEPLDKQVELAKQVQRDLMAIRAMMEALEPPDQ